MGPRVGLPLLVAGALGCGGATPPPDPGVPMILEQPADESLGDLIAAALSADARLELAAPLYTAEAIVVANGETRQVPPRYAGLATGGEVEISSSRIEVRADVAWATVAYRWVSRLEGTAREGLATFVLVPAERGGVGWRIHHAHSSSPPSP